MKETDTDRYCPKCNADFLGEPILEKYLDSYGGSTHYDRRWGFYSMERDRTVAEVCPDCFHVLWGSISEEDLNDLKKNIIKRRAER